MASDRKQDVAAEVAATQARVRRGRQLVDARQVVAARRAAIARDHVVVEGQVES